MEGMMWKAAFVLAWVLAQWPYFLAVVILVTGLAIAVSCIDFERSEKE